MRLIRNTSTDTFFNMAAEEYFLTTADEPMVMLWRNARTVVIGRNQNALQEVNAGFVRDNNIDVVRRLTGGGAVFHDLGNINFTVIQKHESSLYQNYEHFTAPICEYLQAMGVNAVFAGRNDLLIDGRKFSGNAQVVLGKNIMHHGTIMFNANVSELVGALRPHPLKISSKSIKSVQARVTNIAEHLTGKLSADDFYIGLLQTFVGRGYTLTDINGQECRAIEKLAHDKYRTWEWNFGRAPNYTLSKEKLFEFGIVQVQLDIIKGSIASLKIYGDFFGSLAISELERSLCGVRYERAALEHALLTTNINEYITGMGVAQFVELLTV